jgi:hypothetical protein
MENPYELFPKPHMDVQFSNQGPWMLWRTEGTDRVGLVLNPRACQDTQCDCREMTLDFVAVAADPLICASLKPDGLHVKMHEAYTPADASRATGMVKIHIDTGEIIAERSKAHVLDQTWIEQHMDGVFLEHLHQRWLLQKNLASFFIPESLTQAADAGEKAMLPWEQFFAYGRDDIYIVDEKAYWVVDYHCITLDCPCTQVRLVVLDASAHTDTALGSCILETPHTPEPLLEGPLQNHALLKKIWERFLKRHHTTHALYQRRAQVRDALQNPPT